VKITDNLIFVTLRGTAACADKVAHVQERAKVGITVEPRKTDIRVNKFEKIHLAQCKIPHATIVALTFTMPPSLRSLILKMWRFKSIVKALHGMMGEIKSMMAL
jgi:hypothetical protein